MSFTFASPSDVGFTDGRPFARVGGVVALACFLGILEKHCDDANFRLNQVDPELYKNLMHHIWSYTRNDITTWNTFTLAYPRNTT